MDPVLPKLAAAIRKGVLAVQAPAGAGRPSTKELCQALTTGRTIVAKRFGGSVFRRYSGCPDSPGSYSRSGGAFKVLEYLWDFSLSRWAIPQAIEDPRAKTMSNGKFELLLVAESELGTSNEICRDLLKLCEARTRIRCLVYRRPKRTGAQQALEERMIRVLQNHAHFEADPGVWLFVGVTWEPGQIDCHTSTLNADLDAFIPVP